MGARRIRTVVVAALCAVAAASAAQARTYHVVQSGRDSWTVMDPQGVEQVPGTSWRRGWVVTVQRNIHSPGIPPQPGYLRTQFEYDCGAQRVRWLQLAAFSRGGTQLVARENPSPDWGPASDAADTSAGWRVVCEGVGGGSVVSAESIGQVVVSLMQAWDQPPPLVQPPAPGPTPAPKRTQAPRRR